MPESASRSVLFAVLALALAAVSVLAATITDGALIAPWWLLVAGLCVVLPFGAWSARRARSRVVAAIGLLLSSALLTGGLAVTTSPLLVVFVLVPLGVTVTMLLTHRLHGHRALGAVVIVLPLVLMGAIVPVAISEFDPRAWAELDLAAAATAIRESAGIVLLLGGAMMLVGSVLDLASRLRHHLQAETVRSIAFTIGGLTLVLITAAGAVAAGTLSGTASRVGSLAVVLAVAAIAALRRGLRGLARTREVSHVGGAVTVIAVASVLTGTLLSPPDSLTTALSLVALLVLSAVLGAVTGLCGAAALVRVQRHSRPPARVRWNSLRTRLVQS